jgi:hypothetical protein
MGGASTSKANETEANEAHEETRDRGWQARQACQTMSECQNRLGCKGEEAGSTMAKSVAKRETTAQLAAHAAAA